LAEQLTVLNNEILVGGTYVKAIEDFWRNEELEEFPFPDLITENCIFQLSSSKAFFMPKLEIRLP
jgi:hypothetical protein